MNLNWDWPKQKYLNEKGEIGDCWRCCIAAILQLPAEEVPHFIEKQVKNEGNCDADTQRWLNNIGYVLISGKELTLPRWYGDAQSVFPVISCGPTIRSKKTGEWHAIVEMNNELKYDPHPSEVGILETMRQYMIVPMFNREVQIKIK